MTLEIRSQAKGHRRYGREIFREDVKLFKGKVHQQGCRFMEIIGRAHRLHRALTCRGKWGKVSHLFSWLRGGETMKIELFINIDCESLIFCEQIRGKIKNTKFSQNNLK